MKNQLRSFIQENDNQLHLPCGDVVGLTSLGEGGNSLVYSGELYGHSVAIKILTEIMSSKIVRFKAEYFNVSFLRPNPYTVQQILYTHFDFRDNTFPAILMKRYDGSLTRDAANEVGLKNLFEFLIRSLRFIHEHGIVHRDLKPNNILFVQPSGDRVRKYKLADFGI